MAVDPQSHGFNRPDISAEIQAGNLNQDNQLLIDQLTRSEYEPRSGTEFSAVDLGSEAEVSGARFRISGVYRLGTGLAANGSAIVSEGGFARVSPWRPTDWVSLGLVRIAPGQQASEVQQRLVERFQVGQFAQSSGQAASVIVLTRDQAMESEKYRWLWQTPIGLIFQLGVAISLVVGAAIVYMVLATDVAEKLTEYATLLAVGYSRLYLAKVVMSQSTLLACSGFLLAWLLAEILYRITTSLSGISLVMDPSRIGIVFGLGIAMCSVSGLLAVRQCWKAEPANLF
jgi:putative ABC transport system permease protein